MTSRTSLILPVKIWKHELKWCFILNTRPSDECSTSSQFYIEIQDPTERQLCLPCSDLLYCSRKQNPFLFNQNLIYLISEHTSFITFQRIRTYINAYINSPSWDCVDNHLDLVNGGSLMLDRRACSYMQTLGLWNLRWSRWRDVKRDHPDISVCCHVCRGVTGCDSSVEVQPHSNNNPSDRLLWWVFKTTWNLLSEFLSLNTIFFINETLPESRCHHVETVSRLLVTLSSTVVSFSAAVVEQTDCLP